MFSHLLTGKVKEVTHTLKAHSELQSIFLFTNQSNVIISEQPLKAFITNRNYTNHAGGDLSECI